ncbi:hypothetical protein P3342_007581 [Pyrenophora teres f. teres]|nr:hypothetical protein P3342_007581 [Pyrenophora teres f. teres]
MPATEVADDFAEELDQTVRRSSRLAGRPAVPPVVLAISSEDGSERLSHTTPPPLRKMDLFFHHAQMLAGRFSDMICILEHPGLIVVFVSLHLPVKAVLGFLLQIFSCPSILIWELSELLSRLTSVPPAIDNYGNERYSDASNPSLVLGTTATAFLVFYSRNIFVFLRIPKLAIWLSCLRVSEIVAFLFSYSATFSNGAS